MAKGTKDTQGVAEQNQTPAETLEQKVVRLEAEKVEAQKALVAAQAERDLANDIAKESSAKLKKIEGIKSDSTIDIGDDTYKINLKKGALRTSDSPIAVHFQLIKNEDGSVDANHVYPNGSQWKELAEVEGVLTKL
jgi:Tol biopolymer transport system component